MLSINIITRIAEVKMEDVLRENGFGVTGFTGSGRDGELKILNVICTKNNLYKLKNNEDGQIQKMDFDSYPNFLIHQK